MAPFSARRLERESSSITRSMHSLPRIQNCTAGWLRTLPGSHMPGGRNPRPRSQNSEGQTRSKRWETSSSAGPLFWPAAAHVYFHGPGSPSPPAACPSVLTCCGEQVDKGRKDAGVNHALDLLLRPRRDVANGPAGLLHKRIPARQAPMSDCRATGAGHATPTRYFTLPGLASMQSWSI
jgi:hypothetical protein